jgi:hypothetical protein
LFKYGGKTIAQLKIERCVMKDGHLELLLRLEKEKEQINQLTVKLVDAHSEIARLSVADYWSVAYSQWRIL